MLTHPTLDRLNAMGLTGMAKALDELTASGEAEQLSHAEWLGLLIDREWSSRYDRKLAARLRFAKLRHQATPEDVDYRSERGLDRALFLKLIAGDWIDAHDNLVICGPAARWQELVGLRARPQGLPRRSLRSLSALAAPVRQSGARPRRRPLRAVHAQARQRSVVHP